MAYIGRDYHIGPYRSVPSTLFISPNNIYNLGLLQNCSKMGGTNFINLSDEFPL